jgi:hypothetical protein
MTRAEADLSRCDPRRTSLELGYAQLSAPARRNSALRAISLLPLDDLPISI